MGASKYEYKFCGISPTPGVLLEEAEGVWVEVPTRKVKPSQTCPVCGAVEKTTLSTRRHKCGSCGHTADRDVAAAHVMLNWALEDMKKAA